MLSFFDSPFFNAARIGFALFAIVGNIFIIVTIQKFAKLRSKSYNGLICILAFSDLVVGVGLLIRTVAYMIHSSDGKDEYSVGYCISLGATHMFGFHLSQLSILVIACDRLYGIVSPIGYKQNDPFKYPVRCLVFVLTFSTLGLVVLYFGTEKNKVAAVCNTGTSDVDSIFARYWAAFFITVSLCIFVAYGTTIFVISRRSSRRCKGEIEREFSRQKRVFITISIVLLSYFICTVTPVALVTIGMFMRAESEFFASVVIVGGLLSGMNASNNILIYGWKYEELRTHMAHLLRCRGDSAATLKRHNSSYFFQRIGDVFV